MVRRLVTTAPAAGLVEPAPVVIPAALAEAPVTGRYRGRRTALRAEASRRLLASQFPSARFLRRLVAGAALAGGGFVVLASPVSADEIGSSDDLEVSSDSAESGEGGLVVDGGTDGVEAGDGASGSDGDDGGVVGDGDTTGDDSIEVDLGTEGDSSEGEVDGASDGGSGSGDTVGDMDGGGGGLSLETAELSTQAVFEVAGGEMSTAEVGTVVNELISDGPIPIPGEGTLGPADPYPSIIEVDGLGLITDVAVILNDFTHTYLSDLMIVAEAPSGSTVALSLRCGDWSGADGTYRFEDGAVLIPQFPDLEALPPGTYAPSTCTEETLVDLGPAGPYGSDFSSLQGEDPNGEWRLWITDRGFGDTGSLWSWTLVLSTVNQAPVANADSYTVDEDQVLEVSAADGVLANDTDDSDAALGLGLVSAPSNGGLILNPDGSFTYIPNLDFTGTDSFTYQVSDGELDSDVATVMITVTPVNDAPVAEPDFYSVDEDGVLSVNASDGVLANDSDVDGDPLLSALLESDVSHGTLSFTSSGAFTYTPNADFHGVDSFTYRVTDTRGGFSDEVTVTITVNPVNDAPVANDDAYSVDEDTELRVFAWESPVANDVDVDGNTLHPQLVTAPSNGFVSFFGEGNETYGILYRPLSDFHGTDTFTYRVFDGTEWSNVATVTITINPVNDAPVAVDDTVVTDEDTPLVINAQADLLPNDSDVDGDVLVVDSITQPANGSASLQDGVIVYTPNADYHGPNSFTYTITDGNGEFATATVFINVVSVNDAPVGVGDVYSVDEDTPLVVGVDDGLLVNDGDVDGDELTVVLVSAPSHGDLLFNADGSFTYTPHLDFNGTDSFTYQANDGALDSDIVTVTITTHPVNDAPVAVGDVYSVDEDMPLVVGVDDGLLVNDGDVDGDELTVVLVQGPANGTVDLNDDGSFTYTPHLDFNGEDTFTYEVTDGLLTSETVTVTITVNPVNDAPVIGTDVLVLDTPYGTAVSGSLAGLVSDVDGDPLTFSLASGPANGTVVLNSDGTFTYTPNAGFSGVDAFTYAVSDGVDTIVAIALAPAATATGTVQITVGPAPVIPPTPRGPVEPVVASLSVAGAPMPVALPRTGTDPSFQGLAGLGLLTLGAVASVSGRRRRRRLADAGSTRFAGTPVVRPLD